MPGLRQAPAVMRRQKADYDDQNRAAEHGNMLRGDCAQETKEQCADDGCCGINMLDENIGRIACHHVPEQTTADTCDDADKDRKKHIRLCGDGKGARCAGDRKDAKSDGVREQHQKRVSFQKVPDLRDKDDEAGENRGDRVNRVVKHCGRERAENDVSGDTAADCNGQAEHAGAEDIHIFANPGHCAGDGERRSADQF